MYRHHKSSEQKQDHRAVLLDRQRRNPVPPGRYFAKDESSSRDGHAGFSVMENRVLASWPVSTGAFKFGSVGAAARVDVGRHTSSGSVKHIGRYTF
jgi:hypothetical protein